MTSARGAVIVSARLDPHVFTGRAGANFLTPTCVRIGGRTPAIEGARIREQCSLQCFQDRRPGIGRFRHHPGPALPASHAGGHRDDIEMDCVPLLRRRTRRLLRIGKRLLCTGNGIAGGLGRSGTLAGSGIPPGRRARGSRGQSRGERKPGKEAGENGRQANRRRHGCLNRQTTFGRMVGAERGGRSRRRQGADQKADHLPRLLVVVANHRRRGNRQRSALNFTPMSVWAKRRWLLLLIRIAE